MPSFLNKVFGYKKHDDKDLVRPTREPSDSTLLDGKYEAIAPVLSPTGSTFPEAQQTKDPDRDTGFSLFIPKIRGFSQRFSQKHPENFPQLTLHLPGPKENLDSRDLGVVFEVNPDSQIVLDDAVIAAKRLNPLEVLILIKACTQAIAEHGLETLGIMHPHWFSASPDVQRKLISLFIRSLTQSRITTLSPLSPTPNSPTLAFENELRYTRSPHDVAAVLRWGLRHLSLENDHFGKDSAEWGWYRAFLQAERNASYPLKGFSELLFPQLPPSHIELLTAMLNLISSLAARAEENGISGSKLSKFLGLWLLVATRAEQSDDWNRFYARWERAGRVLEHLFLARLREDSLGPRLPTRLQELVKGYPYNKGSLVMDDDLLSRPRFSTRQYDALFVRVESTLARNAEQPKQHPIKLLLEAFQLPIDNPSGDEHIVLWNALKNTVFEQATSSDPEGPQFTRVFVDETIHLLSLIPADNGLPTSPTLLTTPITQVMSRQSTSSLTKAFELPVYKSNTNDGSTPVSPTSPSSAVVTDWAQFTLSGFGDNPTTQPLSTLFSQDEDVEVTEPRTSRKSSRYRGKSRSRRRRSEDHESSDTPPSSQRGPEPRIIETKLASIQVVQIDEAFIDFWSDAIVDPISANWPTFVVCGLKQIQSAEQPIRWLVIEQAYRQELQSSRVPSPDGHRGRSPRPSFKSDISGFRINSVLSSARKRFSLFSKSATDLDLRKSGGKTPVAGELGEILVEEELTIPSALTPQSGLHVDGNAAVSVTVTDGAINDVPDRSKTDEISTVLAVDVPSTSKEGSYTVQPAEKAPSIEPTAQAEGGYNGSSLLLRPSANTSEETISAQQSFPRSLDIVDPKVNGLANLVIAPQTIDTQSAQPMVLAPSPAPSVESPVTGAVEANDRPVELVSQTADQDEHLRAESTGDPFNMIQLDVADSGSREDSEAVVVSSTLETVALVAVTPAAQCAVVAVIDDEAPESTLEEPRVAKEPLQKASINPVAASTVESVHGQEIDDLSLVPVTEAIPTETGAQLEPHSITSVVNEVEEVQEIAEHAEIPTPALERVVLVEETPGQDVFADVCGHGGAVQSPAAQLEALDDVAPQLEVLDDAASQPVAAELQDSLQAETSFVAHPVEAPSDEVAGTSIQAVAAETEHITDQVPELATEEAGPHAQDAIVQIAGAPLATLGVEADVVSTVSALQAEDVAPVEVEAQTTPESYVHEDLIIETQDTGTPPPVEEHTTLFDETGDPVIAVDGQEAVDSALTPETKEVETKSQDPTVEVVVETQARSIVDMPLVEEVQPFSGAELPTQIGDTQTAAEALPTGINLEAATAALATQDEVVVAKPETKSIPDALTAEAPASVLESAPIEDASEVAIPVQNTVTEPEPVEDQASEPADEVILVDVAPTASESVAITSIVPVEEPAAHDTQAPIEIDQLSGAFTPQFDDEAANSTPAIVVVSVPEEIVVVEVEASEMQPEPEVVQSTVDTVDEPLIEDAEPESLVVESELVDVVASPPVIEDAPAPVEVEKSFSVAVEAPEEVASQLEMCEPTQVDEPQKVVDLTEAEAVTSEVDVPTHEPTGVLFETPSAES